MSIQKHHPIIKQIKNQIQEGGKAYAEYASRQKIESAFQEIASFYGKTPNSKRVFAIRHPHDKRSRAAKASGIKATVGIVGMNMPIVGYDAENRCIQRYQIIYTVGTGCYKTLYRLAKEFNVNLY